MIMSDLRRSERYKVIPGKYMINCKVKKRLLNCMNGIINFSREVMM